MLAVTQKVAQWGAQSPYFGHTDSRTTDRHYARFSPDYLRKAAGALDW